MNPLHLFWIIPASASVGAFVMAILPGAGDGYCMEFDHIRLLRRDAVHRSQKRGGYV